MQINIKIHIIQWDKNNAEGQRFNTIIHNDEIYIDFLNVQVLSTNIQYSTAGRGRLVIGVGRVHSKKEDHFDPVNGTQKQLLFFVFVFFFF